MPIPYGKPLIAMLTALEEAGRAATAAQIRQRVPAGLQAKTSHACHWAVVYGLMQEDCSQRPRLYSLAPDWRERVEARQAGALAAVAAALAAPPEPPVTGGQPRDTLAPALTLAAALASRHPLELAWTNIGQIDL